MAHPHNRRVTDGQEVRLLIGTAVVSTFLILGTLAFAIVNTNVRVDQNIKTVEDGITCVLGSLAGHEGTERPDEDAVDAACALFIREADRLR